MLSILLTPNSSWVFFFLISFVPPWNISLPCQKVQVCAPVRTQSFGEPVQQWHLEDLTIRILPLPPDFATFLYRWRFGDEVSEHLLVVQARLKDSREARREATLQCTLGLWCFLGTHAPAPECPGLLLIQLHVWMSWHTGHIIPMGQVPTGWPQEGQCRDPLNPAWGGSQWGYPFSSP